MEITLPYKWFPREYQLPLWTYLERQMQAAAARDYEGTGPRAVAVWHRRAGKDLTMIHWGCREAFRRRGLYWHILPTYKQARKVVWENQTRDGVRFIDAFPESLIERRRDDEMKLWLRNGSQYQLIGADDPDSLVGPNPIGLIFSEWSVMNPYVWELLRPILTENGGWSVWIYTPRGRNHGYKLLKDAQKVGWFNEVLPYQKTGVVTADQVQAEIDAGMAPEKAAQEYECSFDAPLAGSYWGDLITAAEQDGRITRVRAEAQAPVHTCWDLGIGDSTSIWFYQELHAETRFLDYYFASGKGIDHYADVLQKRRDRDSWVYGSHMVPHDAKQRSLQTGQSLSRTARELGLRMTVVEKDSLANGIQAVRNMLPRCWFDEDRCAIGLQGLREYSREEIEGERDPEGNQMYRDAPIHNWASHPADAIRTGAMARKVRRAKEHRILAPKLAIA